MFQRSIHSNLQKPKDISKKHTYMMSKQRRFVFYYNTEILNYIYH